MKVLEIVKTRAEEIVKKLEKLGLPRIEFTIELTSLRPGVAGTANTFHKRICISKEFLVENQKEMIAETVPHEVCHLYIDKYFPFAKQAHGPEFRRMMQKLGCTGATKHSMARPAVQGARKAKTVRRFVYMTEHTKKEVLLTVQQHKKQSVFGMVNGRTLYVSKKSKENLVYAGQVRKF